MIDTATFLFALAALGSQWGYQTAGDGTMEYIIQLRPQEAQHLASSPEVEITSYVPDDAQPVGRIRIVVGDEALPRGAESNEEASTADSALALNDSHGRPIAAGQEAPITETQSRVARQPAAEGESAAADQNAARGDLDKDLAGRLVAIPAEPEPARVAQRQDPLQSPAEEGSPSQEESNDAAGDEPLAARAVTTDSQEPADGNAEDQRQPELPQGITQPVYTTGRPDPIESDIGLPSFDPVEPKGVAARGDASPSDRPDGTEGPQSESGDFGEEDRPWLPLAGAIAAACGFLAGNVFQWRSYLSLRKRYLNLLRKSGG